MRCRARRHGVRKRVTTLRRPATIRAWRFDRCSGSSSAHRELPPSRLNVNTGRITRAMLTTIFREVRDYVDDSPYADGASVGG